MTTTLATPVRAPVSVNRRYLAAGTFILLGLIDIFAFGLFAHHGDAVFALSLPGATPKLPGIHVPGALTAYVLGAISIGLGILRAVVDLSPRGKRITIAIALLCFLFFPIGIIPCWLMRYKECSKCGATSDGKFHM